MNRATFMHFLRNTQGENVDDASVEELMLSLGSADGREIDKTEFLEFLSSPEHNSFIKKEKLFNVYQDMTRPICDYFINSSHNTYLTGDQLASKSSTDMYRKALLEGCRCVELDCWNGSKDEPVVYHGHTRTSKILFSDCIKAIKDTAFQNSPFPVILSLEVHTNLTQQDRMADIMVEIFGELLLKPAWGSGEPPTYSFSPEQLKNKILVKTKRGNFASEPGVDKDEDDEDDDVVTPSVSVNEDYKKAKEERKKDEKVDISEKLSAAVCIESTGYKGVDDLSYLSTRQPYNCSSLSEGKAKKLYQQNFEAFVKINQKCLSRIYPAGIRFDSSNYNPQIYWNCGCQIVALNWQSTKTFEWRFNRSFFLDNGNCGYLLKPEELCAPNTGVPKSSDKRSIFVSIISGFCLPKAKHNSDIVDPYVSLFIEGPDTDSNPKKTKAISDNGIHPVWHGLDGSEFAWEVSDWSMSSLVTQVFDKGSNGLIGENILPLRIINKGYRHVSLHDVSGQPIPGAALMINVSYI
ncbi:1-phosphatidylinositol-4,5-bisphosphate phosphodiesterase [Strigomonas culicis]|nr:1-phosphatidylinositol-4,5-bisphosphate phosphodiesterase [Strigomonas culicis]|eukprot:EPY18840.1 1-phosphatidylinositol-4,5-bisphosphate phosphodiesterase [Strigomonas culicis]